MKLKTYDMHGKGVKELDRLIDYLAPRGGLYRLDTGKGRGLLRNRLAELSKMYQFRIVNPSDNGTVFVLDFE